MRPKKPDWWRTLPSGVMVPKGQHRSRKRTQQRCRVRVIGNSRSGTAWFTKVLKAAGLDVGHEFVGPDGTVSCYFFIDTPRYPVSPTTSPVGKVAHVGEQYSDYQFDVTLHIVRNPLKCIGSIWSTMQTQHQLWLEEFKVIPEGLKPKFMKSMFTWLAVNKLCEKEADFRFQLEEVSAKWPKICKLLGLPKQRLPRIPVTNKSRGIFLAKSITWRDMQKMAPAKCAEIARMARRYGYKVNENYIRRL
jgi:hypothetical protein